MPLQKVSLSLCYRGLSTEELLSIIAEKDVQIVASQRQVETAQSGIVSRDKRIFNQQRLIQLLEEQLRLASIRKFAASSEKLPFQINLFDEAEMEVALEDLEEQLPEPHKTPASKQKRNRSFPDALPRKRIELCLSETEKAVFDVDGQEQIVSAPRPVHPLKKCFAHTSLLTYINVAKYADGLPLYRLEGILKRYGNPVSRTNIANWIIRLDEVFKPLINLMRESQNQGRYINADETRIQVLKENGFSVLSDRWMWVPCGGPPDQPSVLFEYDPSRAGTVPERLLADFKGNLQADGYSGYARICQKNQLQRIGCCTQWA